MIKPYPKCVARKAGFERGVTKPHIGKRYGFLYAFKKIEEDKYSWITLFEDEKKNPNLEALLCAYGSTCNRRNIELRGLFE